MFSRLNVFIDIKGLRWILTEFVDIFYFQFSIPDHLKLFVGLFDPLLLSANRLSDCGSHLFARSFSFRCFHIDKKLNVNIGCKDTNKYRNYKSLDNFFAIFRDLAKDGAFVHTSWRRNSAISWNQPKIAITLHQQNKLRQ